MSTHVHFGAISGREPIAKTTQGLHNSFDRWIKARRDLLGPIIASRPATKELPMDAALVLIAYHHNNPVKAGVVDAARESSWTSHRCYLQGTGPDWLDVDLGLALSGLENSKADRNLFDRYVNSSVDVELEHNCQTEKELHESARTALGSSVELGGPRTTPQGAIVAELLTPEDATIHPAWPGNLQVVVEAVAQATGSSADAIRSKTRVRSIVAAR